MASGALVLLAVCITITDTIATPGTSDQTNKVASFQDAIAISEI